MIKLIFLLNIAVAGFVGFTSLFLPHFSAKYVFEETIPVSFSLRLVGCLWLSIALLSIFGFFEPIRYSPVLLIQFIYKLLWLLVIALPLISSGQFSNLPKGMTYFFVIWVVLLAIGMPYSYLFNNFSEK